MGQRTAPFSTTPAPFKRATGLPVFHATRITDLSTARHAVAEGYVDMVGMTRAHIADPHIVAKLLRGEEDRIRPCVGAGYCIDRIYVGGDALASTTPPPGASATMPHVIARGDGAATSAWSSSAAGRPGWKRRGCRPRAGTRWCCSRRPTGWAGRSTSPPGSTGGGRSWGSPAGCSARSSSPASRSASTAYGERRRRAGAGAGHRHRGDRRHAQHRLLRRRRAISSSVAGTCCPGRSALTGEVLVYDENGQHQGPSVAEFLAPARRQGDLRRARPDAGGRAWRHQLGPVHEGALRELACASCRTWPSRRARARATGSSPPSEHVHRAREELRADHIVVEHGTLPADELYHGLKAGSRNHGEIDLDALLTGRPQAT